MSSIDRFRGLVKRRKTSRRGRYLYRFLGMRFASDAKPGQALVLVALLLVLLLGISALAIDGGGVMFLQRDAQNAADAAALAAARYKCTHASEASPYPNAVAAGKTAATQNGFTTGQNGSLARNVTVEVQVGSDFASQPILPTTVSSSKYAVVRINAEKPSFFAHLVSKTPLAVTVSASAICDPGATFSNVGAIYAYGTTCGDDQVNWQGSNATICGGVNSGSGCTWAGSNGSPSTICGGMTSNTPCHVQPSDGTTFDPAPVEGVVGTGIDPLAQLWKPADWAPTSTIARAAKLQTCAAATATTGQVGCYHTEFPAPGSTLEGIYYLTSDGGVGSDTPIQITGSGMQFGPNGATIIVDDTVNGTFKSTGPFTVNEDVTWPSTMPVHEVKPYSLPKTFFDAPGSTFTADEVSFLKKMMYPNWLLVMTNWVATGSVCNTANAGLQTSMSTTFKGVFYASGSGCKFSFSQIDVAFGAVICAKVDFSGSDMNLLWDPSVLPALDPGESQGS
jgi:Flp pilus assembly protein TadG